MRKKLTVSEFAQKVSKSRQTIYNYINKFSDDEKEKYFIIVDNKKYLTIECQNLLLSMFNLSEDIFYEELENQINVFDYDFQDKDDKKKVGYIENDLISFLQEQLKQKDNQIADLHKLLAISNQEKLMLIEKSKDYKESLLSKVKKIFRRD